MPLTTSGAAAVLTASVVAASSPAGLWLGLARRGWPARSMPGARRTRPRVPHPDAVPVRGRRLLFLLVLAVHYVVLAFEAAREAERRQLELEVLTRDAELRALRAQIDPHFLYNSLNSISALTGSDAPGARRMCLLLGEFLRNDARTSARGEQHSARRRARAGRTLSRASSRCGSERACRSSGAIDETALACLVPPLLLQPLVENAVAHGIAGCSRAASIRLDGRETRRPIVPIVIENPRDADAAPRGAAASGWTTSADGWPRCSAATRAHGRRGRAPSSFRVELELPCIDGVS